MVIELADVIWTGVLLVVAPAGALLYLKQDRWVFKPSHKIFGTPADYGMRYEDVYLGSPRQELLHGWWIEGNNDDKVILFFHGTTGNITYELPTIRFLNSLGISVLTVDYPGYGRSQGQPSEQGCLGAADSARNFLVQTKGYDPGDIIHYGKSLGGAVAAYLAAKDKSAGLVLHGCFTSIPDMAAQLYPFFPIVRMFVRTKLNCLAWLKQCNGPLLLLHAKADEFVPVSHAHRLYQNATVPKKFIEIEGVHDSNEWLHSNRVHRAWLRLLAHQLDDWEMPEFDVHLKESRA